MFLETELSRPAEYISRLQQVLVDYKVDKSINNVNCQETES